MIELNKMVVTLAFVRYCLGLSYTTTQNDGLQNSLTKVDEFPGTIVTHASEVTVQIYYLRISILRCDQ